MGGTCKIINPIYELCRYIISQLKFEVGWRWGGYRNGSYAIHAALYARPRDDIG